jgi:DNA-binding transcriptional regulator YiaG
MSIQHIRTKVFKLTQAKFAELIGIDQAMVSRWESERSEPGLTQMGKIRKLAKRRVGKGWKDSFFWSGRSQID